MKNEFAKLVEELANKNDEALKKLAALKQFDSFQKDEQEENSKAKSNRVDKTYKKDENLRIEDKNSQRNVNRKK